jgi:hypothetical protein
MSHVSLLRSRSLTEINDDNKTNKILFLGAIKLTERCHQDKLIFLVIGLLLDHLLFTCGGLYIARVSSQKIISQQIVGNNVHELTKGGSSCDQQIMVHFPLEIENSMEKWKNGATKVALIVYKLGITLLD